ncbi:MAG: cytochrome-c peroxidase, partial [Flavobacteriales bacterium]
MAPHHVNTLLLFALLAGSMGCSRLEKPPLVDGADVHLPDLPSEAYAYSQMGFPDLWLNDPALQLFGGFGDEIEITDAGATLGRVLFHDVQLSADNTVSCGSCHKQEFAFADAASGSTGISGHVLHRNTPGLFNLRYQRRLFWDLRVVGLANQVLQPIGHPDEMGMPLDVLPDKLAALPYYPALFEQAFGDPFIDLDRITDALIQFLRSIRSTSSRYDEGLANGFASFTESELLGKSVFFRSDTRCNQCHSGLNFFATQPFINGLEVDYGQAGDGGIGELSGNASDDGRFKTVSLRNVGLTAPYMHDGRFAILREVVDFYSDGIQAHPFLDERLSENGIGPAGQEPYRLELSEAERQGLVDFL